MTSVIKEEKEVELTPLYLKKYTDHIDGYKQHKQSKVLTYTEKSKTKKT
ncbi:hypothetical protein [Planococcus versutus]|nr:hypothetical protein [Planococcus versutus]